MLTCLLEERTSCTRIFCQSTLIADERLGENVWLRQPSLLHLVGGVYLAKTQAAIEMFDDDCHAN